MQQRFLRRAIELIRTKKGIVTEPPPWLITSFEVDIEERLGGGGYSDIHAGRWQGSLVAVKILKPGNSADLQANEIKIWERLRHPHVLRKLFLPLRLLC